MVRPTSSPEAESPSRQVPADAATPSPYLNKGNSLASLIAARASSQRCPPSLMTPLAKDLKLAPKPLESAEVSSTIADLVASFGGAAIATPAAHRARALSAMADELSEYFGASPHPSVQLGLGAIKLQAAMYKHLSILQSSSS